MKRERPLSFKVNDYLTLKLEDGKTFIYIQGKKFLQCMRLVLNILPEDVPEYDEIKSIDEAAEINKKHLWQNRIVQGPRAHPVREQGHTITREQEFWGHCSNLQVWVEHGYDTRLLHSNLAFPLLKKLVEAGDPLAKKVIKEEIAKRFESRNPSVQKFLINEHYLQYFTIDELNILFQIYLENNADYEDLMW